jgi:hypothetical protein
MIRDPKKISISGIISLMLVIINALILRAALVTGNEQWYLAFVFTIPLLLIAISNIRKIKK